MVGLSGGDHEQWTVGPEMHALQVVEKMPGAKGQSGPSLMKELDGAGESIKGNHLKNGDVESFEKRGYQK